MTELASPMSGANLTFSGNGTICNVLGAIWLVEMVTLQVILFSGRRQKKPNGRAANLCAPRWLSAIFFGSCARNGISFGQNTQIKYADRMMYTRSPGKLVWSPILPDQCRDAKCDFEKHQHLQGFVHYSFISYWILLAFAMFKSRRGYMAFRDGYSSSNIIFRPPAKQAEWSSRNFVRTEVVNHDFLKILHTEWDQRPSEHASDYGGSNGLY